MHKRFFAVTVAGHTGIISAANAAQARRQGITIARREGIKGDVAVRLATPDDLAFDAATGRNSNFAAGGTDEAKEK